ncbi:hypothetical protein IW262DRAFT_552989 [Armillaria fumosa]|nr:hypothetical protein IW262DRAFT_552989 [Armillaria fumosa]
MERLTAKQIDALQVQAKALAAQIHQHHLQIVSMACRKTLFIEEPFVPARIVFTDPAQILSALQASDLAQSLRYILSSFSQSLRRAQYFFSVCFLPLPPRSMPLHIPRIAQAGYRFHPPITITEGTPVGLVIEAKPHEWLYLGRYLSAPLDGGNMKLSRWIEWKLRLRWPIAPPLVGL